MKREILPQIMTPIRCIQRPDRQCPIDQPPQLQQAGQEPLKLRYFGHSGTEFTEKGLADALQRLKPFLTGKPTVEDPPKIPEKIQWVEPRLVCEVAFAEWTEDEQLRQTTFLGWRDGKTPEEVVLEVH